MSQYQRLLSQSPGITLGAALEFVQDDFRDEFLALWGLDAPEPPEGMDRDDWIAARRVFGMARQVADIARFLLKKKGVGAGRLQVGDHLANEAAAQQQKIDELLKVLGEQLPELLPDAQRVFNALSPDDPRTHRLIYENTLQLEATKLLPRRLDDVAARLQRLVEYVVASRGERTNAYLTRVATCYCLDLRAELAVMARAVLDAALQEIIADDDVRKQKGLRRSDRVGLQHRIDCIEALGLVASSAVASMRAIKTGGDNAIHLAPGTEPNPDTVMADLLASLSAIEKFPSRGD